MNATLKPVSIFLSAALLVGCGGGDSFDTATYQNAVGAAVTKEAEARALAVDTPCDTILQCGVLVFTDPKDQCAMPLYKPYSLVSVTFKTSESVSVAVSAVRPDESANFDEGESIRAAIMDNAKSRFREGE